MHEPKDSTHVESCGSAYKADICLAFVCRGGMLIGLCLLAFTLANCGGDRTHEGGLPPLDIRSKASLDADRGARTRNNLPTIDGGDYEKSDCAPPRPPG